MSRNRVDIEYIFKASPAIIYQFLKLPENLVRWYADGVDITGDVYTFSWDGSEEKAELIDDLEEERVRFERLDTDESNDYYEFRMYKSKLTRQTILEITDFCDKGEEKEIQDLWDSQIEELRSACGG